eukprot:TRINITY_DN3942_c0_g2_i1.p1 TRINITY_DN3942_c0_g2~~TRINITY_DN3942_c0_g2_i1.p1  ORF type:complete len:401 (-),score=121.81 TRINITY_DN3942_c0_g2_i1:43-1245(-)
MSNEIIEIVENGGVTKEIITPGRGELTPMIGFDVSVHYVGYLEDGTKFDSSRDRGEPFDFKLQYGSVIKGWVEAVQTMKLGEVANVKIQSEYAYGEKSFPPSIPAHANLLFEIEIISFGRITDISKDGGIIKNELVSSTGGWQTPSYETICSANITGKLGSDEGDVFYNVTEHTFTIGEGHIPDHLEQVVTTMKMGERSSITVQPSHGYGDEGLEGEVSVPPGTILYYVVELLHFIKPKEAFDLDNFEEKVELLERRREDGNKFFKEGKVDLAIKKYEAALGVFEFTSDLEPEELNEAKGVKMLCYLNLSSCFLKKKLPRKALENAEKALEIESFSLKGIFRKALALAEQGEWNKSLKCYETCLEMDPGNKAIIRSKQKLQRTIQKQNAKDKKRFAGMFQ